MDGVPVTGFEGDPVEEAEGGLGIEIESEKGRDVGSGNGGD